MDTSSSTGTDTRARTPTLTEAPRVNASTAVHARSLIGHIQHADQFPGPTADKKINAAMAVACPQAGQNDTPVVNGIVDARSLYGNQTIAATITMRPNCTLLLGVGTYTRAAGAHILFDSGDTIEGANPALGYTLQRATQIQGAVGDMNPVFAYVHGTGGAGAFGVRIENLSIYGPSGSTGISFVHTLYSQINNVVIGGGATIGIKLGFTGGCDCYNSFHEDFVSGSTYGVQIATGAYANQNQWYGGSIGGRTALYLGGQVNTFYSPNCENATIAIEFGPHGSGANTVYNPYLENNKTNVQFDGGVVGDTVFGGAYVGNYVDNSGNTSNMVWTEGTGATAGGNTPNLLAAKGFRLGGNLYRSTMNGGDISLRGGPDGGALFNYGAEATAVYGRTGGYPLYIGPVTSVGGANLNSIATTTLPDPPAPIITQTGAHGATTYNYYVVCRTPRGAWTLPSPAGTITTGSATLDKNNYNTITAACGPGFDIATVLKGGTSGVVLLTDNQENPNGPVGFNDTGQTLAPYTPPTRNATGDVTYASGTVQTRTCTTVANLPIGTGIAAGAMACVTDWSGRTGVCKGKSTNYGLALYNGGGWTCH